MGWDPSDVVKRVGISRSIMEADKNQANARKALGKRRKERTPASSPPRTSDAEAPDDPDEEREEQEEDNYQEWLEQQYPFRVKASLRVVDRSNSRIKWFGKTSSSTDTGDWIKGQFDTEVLELKLEEQMSEKHVNNLTSIIISIKSDNDRSKIQKVTLPRIS